MSKEIQALDPYRAQHGRVGKRTVPYQGTLIVDHANCAIHELHALNLICDPQANALDQLARDWTASGHQVGAADLVSSYELTNGGEQEVTPQMERAWERYKEAERVVGKEFPVIVMVALGDKKPTDSLWPAFLIAVNRLAKHYGHLRG